MNTNPLQALLFDVDGTLADTEEAHRQAFNATFAEAGLDWQWSVALYTDLLAVTGGRERIKHYAQTYLKNFHPPGHRDLDEFAAALHRDKTARYQGYLERGELPLRPGVARLLREARQAGLRLAIATTTSPGNVGGLLKGNLGPEAENWFEVIAAGDMVAAKKPAPDIYHYALDALKLPPENCLALEDSANGVRAALGADLRVLVTVSDYTRADDFSGAGLVVDQFGEPDRPFRVIAGDPGDSRWVDMPLLRRLAAGER